MVIEAHTLPCIGELLDTIHGACWFSTMDLKSGRWQVLICEVDKHKTTFWINNSQLYEFNQVLFSLCNTPATFSWLMDHVLIGLNWEMCLFYVDNDIVFFKTWEKGVMWGEAVLLVEKYFLKIEF